MCVARRTLHIVVQLHIDTIVVAVLINLDKTDLVVFKVVLVLVEYRTDFVPLCLAWILAEDLPFLE